MEIGLLYYFYFIMKATNRVQISIEKFRLQLILYDLQQDPNLLLELVDTQTLDQFSLKVDQQFINTNELLSVIRYTVKYLFEDLIQNQSQLQVTSNYSIILKLKVSRKIIDIEFPTTQKLKTPTAQILSANTNSWKQCLKKGIKLQKNGESDLALEFFQKAKKLNDNNSNCFYSLGIVYEEMKNNEKAIESYKKSIEIDDKNADSYYRLGYIYYSFQDIQKSIGYYEKAYSIDKKRIEPAYNLAIAYFKINDVVKGVTYLLKALEIEPKSNNCLILLTIKLLSTKFQSQTAKQIITVLKNKDNKFQTDCQLSKLRKLIKHQAAIYLGKIKNFGPENIELLMMLVSMLEKKKNWKNAANVQKIYKTIVFMNPICMQAYWGLGKFYQEQKRDIALARKLYMKVRRLQSIAQQQFQYEMKNSFTTYYSQQKHTSSYIDKQSIFDLSMISAIDSNDLEDSFISNQFQKSVSMYQQEGNILDQLFQEGIQNQQDQKYQQAIQFCEQAGKLELKNSSVYYRLNKIANFYLKKQEISKAKYWADKLVKLQPKAELSKLVQKIITKYWKNEIKVGFQCGEEPYISSPYRIGKNNRNKFCVQKTENFILDQEINTLNKSQVPETKYFHKNNRLDNLSVTKRDIELLRSSYPSKIQNPQKDPYNAIGFITAEFRDGETFMAHGTGCLIGRNIVLTAAYNVYQKMRLSVSTDIFYTPAPRFLQRTTYRARKLFFPLQYKAQPKYDSLQFHQQNYNYALIQLDTDQDLQAKYGSLSYDFSWQNSSQYLKVINQLKIIKNIKVIGFPSNSNKKYQFQEFIGEALVDQFYIIYRQPTTKGVGGAPIIQFADQHYFVRGIHAKNLELRTGVKNARAGLKLQSEMFETLKNNFTYTVSCYKLSKIQVQQQSLNKNQLEIIIRELNQKLKLEKENKIKINLNGRCLADQGCKALASANWQKLLVLKLQQNNISDEGCMHLASVKWNNLQALYLWNNKIGEEGCRHLASAYQWHNLQTLNLGKNCIGDQGCRHLASAQWYNLQTLNLWNNKIGDEGCRHLASAQWYNLTELYLSKNKIGKKGCRHLASAQWKKIQTINLWNNKIGDQGCIYLALSQWFNLQILYLGKNQISDQGCRHLASAQWYKLKALILDDNEIGDEGCKHLASAYQHNLETLSLDLNKIQNTVQVLSMFPNLERPQFGTAQNTQLEKREYNVQL